MWTTSRPCGAGQSSLNTRSTEIRDGETGKTASRTTYSLTIRDLRERGMVEEFTTAAERRRIERSADNGGLSPAT